MSRQYFSIEREYRNVLFIYRLLDNSKQLMGHIINDILIWLLKLKIKMTTRYPNPLLWNSLARYWECFFLLLELNN